MLSSPPQWALQVTGTHAYLLFLSLSAIQYCPIHDAASSSSALAGVAYVSDRGGKIYLSMLRDELRGMSQSRPCEGRCSESHFSSHMRCMPNLQIPVAGPLQPCVLALSKRYRTVDA